MKARWFISHPSQQEPAALVFFRTLQQFDEVNPNIEMIWPPGEPMRLAERKVELEQSQLVIAEVSIASTGSGIDLGLAWAANIPVIAFHQGTSVISPIISSVTNSVHVYLTDEHILKVLQTLA